MKVLPAVTLAATLLATTACTAGISINAPRPSSDLLGPNVIFQSH